MPKQGLELPKTARIPDCTERKKDQARGLVERSSGNPLYVNPTGSGAEIL